MPPATCCTCTESGRGWTRCWCANAATTSLLGRARAAATPARTAATAAVAVALASILAVASLLDGIGENGDVAALDRPTMAWIITHRDPILTTVADALSAVGSEVAIVVIGALAVAALAWRRRFDEALLLGFAFGAAESIAFVVKHLVGRARPPAVGPGQKASAVIARKVSQCSKNARGTRAFEAWTSVLRTPSRTLPPAALLDAVVQLLRPPPLGPPEPAGGALISSLCGDARINALEPMRCVLLVSPGRYHEWCRLGSFIGVFPSGRWIVLSLSRS